MSATKHKFKAEINQLLDILVHSLYTQKEIFLRELISNASDALDKLRFVLNQGAETIDPDLELDIKIDFDKDNKTLTIADTGVGMTKDELVENIGTIAHSGSAHFLEKAAEAKEGLDNIIGRFGVGFYSVYMVADQVTVTSKSYLSDQPAVSWTSDGKDEYEISEVESPVKRGTTIEIKLKEDLADEYTEEHSLKHIINTHSNFVSFPIYVKDERVNTIQALWREPKFNIKKEQYEEFYKFLTYDSQGPLKTIHFSVDAPVQFSSLVFIPQKDMDIFGMNRDDYGLDLYVRRVLIQKQNKELLPQYLSFVKGVVDTEDLPLNISRETLQDNILIKKISTTLTKQVLKELANMAEKEPEEYAKFWTEHAKVFKLGYNDFLNKDKFAPLLRFNSSKVEDKAESVSLDAYIERAKDDQKEIYYVSAQSREAANLNPHLEIFRQKDLEVLYLYEPIDEFLMDGLREYKEFKLVAAEHADQEVLDKFKDEKVEDKVEDLAEDEKKNLDGLVGLMKEVLGDKVTEVRISKRLSGSPCCLVAPDGSTTSSMERMIRMMGHDQSIPKKIFEINDKHPLIRNLIKVYEKDNKDDFVRQATEQLFESSLLLEGYLEDPHALVGRVQDLLTKSSGWYADK